jgi:Bacterial Ig domain
LPLAATAAKGLRDTRPPRLRLVRRRLEQAIVLRAGAKDAGGVRSIELSIDGRKRKKRAGASLRFRWNTSQVRPGSHRVTVRAADRSGNVARLRTSLRVHR